MDALKNLASILVRPRATMRRVLDRGADRMFLPIVLLAMFSSALSDVRLSGLRKAFAAHPVPNLALIVTAIVLCIVLVCVGLFYLFAWITFGIGRLFEGRGNARSVRSALAWGFAPVVWALLYRIPAAILLPTQANSLGHARLGDGTFVFNPNAFTGGCGLALVFGLLKIGILIWYLIVASNTLAEANDFSGWRGFATLLLAWISPMIVLLAAVLAKVT